MRVQIQYRVAEPYPRSADLEVGSRLAHVMRETDETWTLRDNHGETHVIDRATLEERVASPATPRWVVCLPIPCLAIGDSVALRWSTRSAPARSPQADDRMGEVVAEDADTVTVLDDQGERHRHWRANGHEVIVPPDDRNRRRLVIVQSAEVSP